MTTTVEIQNLNKKFDLVVLVSSDDDDNVQAHVRNVVAHGYELSSGHHHHVLFTTRFLERDTLYNALEATGLLDEMSLAIQRETSDRDDMTNLKHISLNVLRKQLKQALMDNARLTGLLEYEGERIESLLEIVRQYETSS